MTSHFGRPPNFTRRPLTDGLVGPVLPRGADHHLAEHDVIPAHAHNNSIEATSEPPHVQSRNMHQSFSGGTASEGAVRSTRAPTTWGTNTRKRRAKRTSLDNQRPGSYKRTRRLEQCRLSQRRYREKKRAFNMIIAQNFEHLREEIEACKRDAKKSLLGRNTTEVRADIFHVLERSFASPWYSVNVRDRTFDDNLKRTLAALETSFALDVTMGDLCGVDELMGQLQKYSQYFSNPRVHLKRVKEITAGVVTASAKLSLIDSEFTLRSIFPHLQKVSKSKYDPRLSAGNRLVGQALNCNCSMSLYFDDESGRVTRVEISIDWVSALYQVLGKTEDVSKVLRDAFIAPDCTIGGTSTSGSGEKLPGFFRDNAGLRITTAP
ncbi:hypothetical protein GQ600_10936 [Phytophthora cactorum]|nr:hypothetical protein GQ600_10936 [Phytophthora cactorum]